MSLTIRPNFSFLAYGGTLGIALLLAAMSAGSATAATVTVSSTCTFPKAVATINAAMNQSPCTHSGTFGSSDTVTVPTGTFDIASVVNITKSVTIHGGGKTSTYLQMTSSALSFAIRVADPNIVVKIDNLTLTANFNNFAYGLVVEGANDTNLTNNNLELNYIVVGNFGDTAQGGQRGGGGILVRGARVLMQNSLVYLNAGTFGGGVAATITQNNNGTTAVPTFVAKYSAISLNTAYVTGGGVYFTGGKLDLRSTSLQQNEAPDGAAISVSAAVPNISCNVTRDVPTAAPSEIDDNVATRSGAIVYSIYQGGTTRCTFNDTIGSGNSSPYCTTGAVNCPQ